MDKTLEELVRRAATGDQAATTQLLNSYSGVALNWARQMVKDESLAQNIAQNSLTTALTNLRSLKDPSQFEHWLYSIISSTASSMNAAAGAGMAAAGQGRAVQQPAQGRAVQQSVQGQPMSQNNPQQPGGKKDNSGKIALIVIAAAAVILLCVGGGVLAGRYFAQREAGDTSIEFVADADEADIPEEGAEDSDENEDASDKDTSKSDEAGDEEEAEEEQEEETEAEVPETTEAETTAQAETQQSPVVIVIEQQAGAAQPAPQNSTTTVVQSSSSSSTSLDAIASRVLATNGGYVLPQSNSRYYSSSELNALSKEELRVARNEIYARHGRIFDSADLNAYFNKMPWYRGTVSASSFSDSVFNTYEKKNIEAIQSAEARK